MVPLHKLARLPRHQRLRKCAKFLEEAERSLTLDPDGAVSRQTEYLQTLLSMLVEDGDFSPEAHRGLEDARDASSALGDLDGFVARRQINAARHILLAETGRSVADWDFIDAAGDLNKEKRRVIPGVCVYLEDIRSPFNVGSLFRSAESFGVERIFLSSLCADPRHPRALRSAMGCIDLVPWERRDRDALPPPVMALETGGTDLDSFAFPARATLIVGSEELGVHPASLALADGSAGRVSIPTYGAKGSLNVAVAFGIVMQTWSAALINGSAGFPA